ncbi:MAG: FIST N-terminal domain-containing protein [Acidobacteriota bacterium]
MGTRAGVGISHHRNPKLAGQEAARSALKSAGLDRPDFVFLFASVGYDQEAMLSGVRHATGRAPLAGCSGEGVIAGAEADESNFSVAVMTIASDELSFSHGLETGLREDPEGTGTRVGKTVAARLGTDAQALFVFADGLCFNFDRFASGLARELPADQSLRLFGGTAADNWELKRTYQYRDDQIVSEGVSHVLMSGNARVVWAVSHGCVPLGVERRVTRARGNVIYEIDGKPVLEVLREYLVGEEIESWQKAIVNLSLGFRAPGSMRGYDEYLIRFMPAKDDAAGSVTIPTEVPTGTGIWMTRRDHEKIASGLDRMASEIHARLEGAQPKMVFQFDCAGRGKVVFRDQQKTDLLARLRAGVAPEAPWLGVYTYGEIGPVGTANCFHNYTAVVMAIA